MLKLTIAVLAVALAGTASAEGWRSLRVDASSEAAFQQSLSLFHEKLSRARRSVFGQALTDIWVAGVKEAEAERREFTVEDYYRLVDGLGYEEVVTLTDPSGDTAKDRYRVASLQRAARGRAVAMSPGWAPRAPAFTDSKVLDAGQSMRARALGTSN